MQGQQYIAMRRLTCEHNGKQVTVNPGQVVPTVISSKWPAPAVRAMLNCDHIQLASARPQGELPFIEAEQQAKAQQKQKPLTV